MTARPSPSTSGRLWQVIAALAATVTVCAGMVSAAGPAAAVTTEPLPGTATTKFFTGWFPYWYGNAELDRVVAHAGPNGIVGEVMPFWLYTRYKGGMSAPVCVHDESDNPTQECGYSTPTSSQRAQLQRMHDAGLKALPSFTDESSPRALAGVMATPVKRTVLVTAQVNFIVNNGFDGMDLDYEGFAFNDGQASWATTKPAWIAYIKQLSSALHAHGKLLSVTVPTGEPAASDSSTYGVYAWSEIIDSIDRLRLMTYDYSWDDPGPVGPASWIDRVAAAAIDQLGASNAHKIWLGVTAYGYDWRWSGNCSNSARSRRPTLYPAAAWTLYNQQKAAHRLIPLPGQTGATASWRWDAAAGEYTFRYAEPGTDSVTGKACTSTREVWFQDAKSSVVRGLIAAKYRLGGITMWALGDETPSLWAGGNSLTAYAPQITPIKPVLALTVPVTVSFGASVVVRTTVTRPDGLPFGGVPVTLNWRGSGNAAWTSIATTTADAEGNVAFPAVPTRTGEWQAVAAPEVGRQSAKSAVRATVVTSNVAAAVRLTTTHGASVVSVASRGLVSASLRVRAQGTLIGHVSPAVARQRVWLYRMTTAGTWALVEQRVTTATGAYSFVLPTSRTGLTRYQVLASPTAQYGRGWSVPIIVKVS